MSTTVDMSSDLAEYVSDAVRAQMTSWLESVRSYLHNYDAVKLLPDSDAKSSVMLAFSLDAVTNMFPHVVPEGPLHSVGSVARAGLQRVAVPVFVASKLQEFAHRQYRKRVASLDEALYEDHQKLMRELISHAELLAMNFGNEGDETRPYYKALVSVLVDTFEGVESQNVGSHSIKARMQGLLENSGLIQARHTTVTAGLERSLTALTGKIRLIAENSPAVNGWYRSPLAPKREIWFAPGDDLEWRRNLSGVAYTTHDWHWIRDQATVRQIMSHAYKMEVRRERSYNMGEYVDRVYVVNKRPNRRPAQLLPDFTNPRPHIARAIARAT